MVRLTIAIIAVVLAGGIFFWYTKPAYDGVQTSQAQITQYDQALDKAAQLQQLKQTLLSRYNAFDPNAINRLQKMLPDAVNNIQLILDLSNLASQYGLSLQNVDVSNSNTPSSTAQTPVGAIGQSTAPYDSLTLTFTTTGTYQSFTQFMTSLESSLSLVDLVSLQLSSVSSTPQGSNDASIYSYNLTLRTYWLK